MAFAAAHSSRFSTLFYIIIALLLPLCVANFVKTLHRWILFNTEFSVKGAEDGINLWKI